VLSLCKARISLHTLAPNHGNVPRMLKDAPTFFSLYTFLSQLNLARRLHAHRLWSFIVCVLKGFFDDIEHTVADGCHPADVSDYAHQHLYRLR
jgi:hypothetical protein